LTHIVSEDGEAAETPGKSAVLLQEHWKPTFARKVIDSDMACELLSRVTIAEQDIAWILTIDEFEKVIFSRPACALGPDGLMYVCWQMAPLIVRMALYKLYVHVLQGG
jgi:hypothetical protein